MVRRKTMTPTHKLLSDALRRKFVSHKNEVKFESSPFDRYADIDVPQYGAIVEVDGLYHRKSDDDMRDEEFRKIGRRTIRIKNRVVEKDPDAAADWVITLLKQGKKTKGSK